MINFEDPDSWELIYNGKPYSEGCKYIGTDAYGNHVIHAKGEGYFDFGSDGKAIMSDMYSIRPLSPSNGITPKGRAVEFRNYQPQAHACYFRVNDLYGWTVESGKVHLNTAKPVDFDSCVPNQWPIPNRAAVLAKIDELVDAEEAKNKPQEPQPRLTVKVGDGFSGERMGVQQ